MEELVGRTLGRYEITALIGRGGMATVYKARHPGLNRTVAVKVLHRHLAVDPAFVGRFRREARAVAALRHPNIVRVHDFDNEGDIYFIVMEFIDGPTLASFLKRLFRQGRHLSAPEILRLFSPVCSAIDYAHQRGMVHRDIKPSNIILTREQEPILTDYGIARIAGATAYTSPGVVIGSAHYMSPEQAEGLPGDNRSDIYSLGIVLFEALTGSVPFQGETPMSVAIKHVSAAPPSALSLNPDLPPAIEAVLNKALAKDPNDRYQQGSDLALALEEVLDQAAELPASAAGTTTVEEPTVEVTRPSAGKPTRVVEPTLAAEPSLTIPPAPVRRRRAGLFGLPSFVLLAAVIAAVATIIVALIVLGAARLSEDNGESAKVVATRSVQPATSTSTSTQVAPATTVEQPVPSGPDSPGVERETNNEVDDYSPVLSPDGSSLAYVSLRNNVWNLYLLDLKTLNEVQLTEGGNAWNPTFSPGGGSILFSMEDGSTHSLFRLDLEDKALSEITTGETNDYYPRERADGTIVFYSDRGGGTTSIFVLHPKTNEVRQMTDPDGSDYWPSWSPDGSSIVFDSDRSGNEDLYLLSTETGQTTQLTSEPGRDAVGSFSPDGRWLVFESDRSGTHQIYVMDMAQPGETREVFQITDFPFGAYVASFSSDGETLVFQAQTETGFEIFRMPFPLAARQTSPAAPTVVAQATPIATAAAIATETPPDFSAFAKGWWRHGFGLTIDPNGQGGATWRVYKWCSDDPTPPCDAVVENQIIAGGSATLAFDRVDGATAFGRVVSSNDEPMFAADSEVLLTLLPYDMATLRYGVGSEMTLCGPNFADLAPKAVLDTFPCGA